MAIFFDKVPREIRDKIYHLLLVDEANAIELKRAKACINLQPTILRTCKQAYEEAMPMMYEKNTFLFKSWAATGLGPCQYGKSSLHNCDPLKANFRRIKHLELHHSGDAPFDDIDNHPYETSDTMSYIHHSGCSLKALHLKYTFCKVWGFYDDIEDHRFDDAITNLGHDDELIQDIIDLDIENVITVTAEGYQKKYCDSFAHLVNDVAFTKKWAITEHRQFETHVRKRVVFARTWTLKPVTATTMDKVPTIHESDRAIGELYERTMLAFRKIKV